MSAPLTRSALLLSGLRHYWRSHLAVALGTAVAAAVLGGALVVGTSVRASLRAMTLERLGAVDFAITGPRFFRESLGTESAEAAAAGGLEIKVAPAIVATAALETGTADQRRRAAGVTVVGADARLWDLLKHGDLPPPAANDILLSRRTADAIRAKVGDPVSVLVEIPPTIPRDALLGDREQTVAELLLTVSGIADETEGLARFGLNPSQQVPLNAFVNLKQLQEQLNVAETPRSQYNPVARVARVNSLFYSRGPGAASVPADIAEAQKLTAALHQRLELPDLYLRMVDHSDRGYVSLESEQMMIDRSLEGTAAQAEGTASHRSVLVYLLNEIANPAKPDRRSMYSVAAGVDLVTMMQPPAAADASPPAPLSAGALPRPAPATGEAPVEVLINQWLADDLEAAVGDLLIAKYHQVGDRGELPEVTRSLRVTGIVPLAPPWDDQGLVPYVPGITDADTFREWRQPFPMKMDDITARDEEYWKKYRATPKVFLPLATAQSLWQSRYGDVTSIGFPRTTLAAAEENFLQSITPAVTGLYVQPVKWQGLQSAQGTTDFAGLFLGFSFFLIGAAAILIALLFRLGVERRIRELGLLAAVGWTSRDVGRHALGEALAVVHAGALVGLPLAVGYAALMIYGLKTWWNAAVGTQFLFLSVDPMQLIGGGVAAILIAAASVLLGLRSARRLTPRAMLAGAVDASPGQRAAGSRWRTWALPIVCATLAAALVAASLLGLIPSKEAFAGITVTAVAFFLSGALALAAGMTAFSALLKSPESAGPSGPRLSLGRMCLRNAARNPRRSAMTAGLVAAAAFLVAAVASGRRNPAVELPDPASGNGGFLLVAESSTPILYDLNTEFGRAQLGLDASPAGPWPDIRIVPFRVQPGENASCLNLYQTRLPTILALPDDLIREFAKTARFRFIGMPPAKAWETLLGGEAGGSIPVLGDINTLQYSLHKGPGDRIPLDDAPSRRGRELEIAGMFDSSIFQGVLLMSESRFKQLYPERVGSQYFLVEAPKVQTVAQARTEAESISGRLETGLRDYGVDAERVADRLADFLAVQNTYLSTFQTLGGLGLLLGIFGVFAVMLRNVFERRGELALLRAVGLPDRKTAAVVLGENLLLVGWGLVTGILAALLAMAPHLISTGGMPPWRGLALLAVSVLAAGVIAAVLALRDALSTAIVPALRNE